VKGRCPRPLDDRVTKTANIRIAALARKANCQLKSAYRLLTTRLRGRYGAAGRPRDRGVARPSLVLLLRVKLVDQCRCARSRATVSVQHFARIVNQLVPGSVIPQQLFDYALEGIDIANLDRAFF
jgi:hypothetical protein